ncbi:SGNH hydrolase-type esterase domain-containing protein [Mycena galopus ATCC 62051]|nr:SGNH hydrolase-type esterase domain-containing protein [Mycena galopus ATCC 62051]
MAANVQDVIMLFGDSITQMGWAEHAFGARLAHAYSRKLDVLNRGFGGYNTEWAIPVLKQCLARQDDQQHLPNVKLLVVWFGANDAAIEPSRQHVPLPKFIENIKSMVKLVHSAESQYYSPTTKIILITPPPINTHQWGADLASRNPPGALDRLFNTTKQYAEGVKEAAAALDVPVVDVWTAIWHAAGENEQALSRYLLDGLHLKPEGYAANKVVYEALMETIAERHPELHYERLQNVFPGWNEIDVANPGPSVQRKA